MANVTDTPPTTILSSTSSVVDVFSTIATNTTDDASPYVTFIASWYCKLIAGLCTFAAIGE